jgi:hypothetical protein
MDSQHEKPTKNMIDRNNTSVLVKFKDSINEQVAAIHAACRDFLARQGQTDTSVPREIRIDIRVSLDAPESPSRALVSADSSMECWDHTYPCGKSPSGYIYCTQRVCMIVGPVTVES